MMASRRLPRPTPCPAYQPSSSGPRWRIESVMRSSSGCSTQRPERSRTAAMPHIPGYASAAAAVRATPCRAGRTASRRARRGMRVVSPTTSPAAVPPPSSKTGSAPTARPAASAICADRDDLVAGDVDDLVPVDCERREDRGDRVVDVDRIHARPPARVERDGRAGAHAADDARDHAVDLARPVGREEAQRDGPVELVGVARDEVLGMDLRRRVELVVAAPGRSRGTARRRVRRRCRTTRARNGAHRVRAHASSSPSVESVLTR